MPEDADEHSPLVVDFAAFAGRFRALHGVNNGPLCFGGVVDLTAWHRSLNLPCTRLHDCGWPESVVVDVPAVYPDLDADPDDPESYRFAKTDDYLASVVPLTDRVIYRLGASVEHSRQKYHTAPPKDYLAWARGCVGIVRHLNEGWAGGHHFGIRDFEIWNEPDLGPAMWTGTPTEYFQLYATTATELKRHDAGLRVGGPALASPGEEFGEAFLRHVRAEGAPLDFFSWHTYTDDPAVFRTRGEQMRSLLDRYGFHDTESVITEWNLVGPADWGRIMAEPPFAREHFETVLGGPDGAAFVASSIMALQDAAVDEACYYTGDTSWMGLFDAYGLPRKPYYALRALAELMRSPVRVQVRGRGRSGLSAVAGLAEGGDLATILVSNYRGRSGPVRLAVANRPPVLATATVEVSAVDDRLDLEVTGTERLPADESDIVLDLAGSGVYLVTLREA